MQHSIANFYDNLAYPNVILNAFLQGKYCQGVQDTLRFVVNSTIGGVGLFDMASPMGLPSHDEDFGQTLGVWGVNANTYIFIPLLGPSSNRDAPGIPVSAVTSVLFWTSIYAVGAPVTIPLGTLAAIQKRARLVRPMRLRDEAALDPYLFVRDSLFAAAQASDIRWQHATGELRECFARGKLRPSDCRKIRNRLRLAKDSASFAGQDG